MKVKITKLTDNIFGGNHPRGINEGYTRTGILTNPPKVNESCWVDNYFVTSAVVKIISENDKEIIFQTLNSTYKLEYLNK